MTDLQADIRFIHEDYLSDIIQRIVIYCDSMDDARKKMKERFGDCKILSIELARVKKREVEKDG